MPCSTNLHGVKAMQSRAVHYTDESTVSALANRKNGQTLRVLARELGHPYFSIATLSDVLRRRPGAVSLHTENDLRLRLELPAIGLTLTPVCPVHGEPHVADCHGAPVAAVITLAPGERVQRPGKPDPRPPCYRPRLAIDLVTRIAQLEALLQAARHELETNHV